MKPSFKETQLSSHELLSCLPHCPAAQLWKPLETIFSFHINFPSYAQLHNNSHISDNSDNSDFCNHFYCITKGHFTVPNIPYITYYTYTRYLLHYLLCITLYITYYTYKHFCYTTFYTLHYSLHYILHCSTLLYCTYMRVLVLFQILSL